MNFFIYDKNKLYFHLYSKYIINDGLISIKNFSNCKNLNIIFIASEINDFFDYCKIKSDNKVILIVEDPFLIKKIIIARNVKFCKLSDAIKKYVNFQN